jgi:NodT family efflux transporter outer membrane factor (OMF) lipoprotein
MKSTRISWTRVLPLIAATAAGCAVGPDFHAPAAPQTDHYTAQPLPAQTASVAVAGGEAQRFINGAALPAQWWTLFDSEPLNQLVAAAFAGSPTADAARAALRQAQEQLNAQRGGFFPSIDANGSAQRQKTSAAALGAAGLDGGSTSIYNLYNASVDVSYTLDLFGGVRRGVEAQAAAVDYQQYQLQATYLTLAANVVTAGIGEASLRAQVAATRDIIATFERQLNITERQYRLGSAAYADVLSARSNLAATRATLPALEKQLAATQSQLAVYLGRLPSAQKPAQLELDALKLPENIPLLLPSELVRRRPDVRAAEALLHEASARVGVATANLFPQLSLSGSYGSQATRSGDLFKDDIWSIGAGLTQPLFHGGALSAQRRAAIAAYDQSAADYRRAVLVAFQNVADSLRALETDARSLQAQHEAMTAAANSLQLQEQQYQVGGLSYLNLLTAQRQYQQARINYLLALASRYQDTAALFQALGGGWNDTSPAAQPATAAAAQQ